MNRFAALGLMILAGGCTPAAKSSARTGDQAVNPSPSASAPNQPDSDPAPPVAGPPVALAPAKAFLPDATPYPKGTLNLGGVRFPVTLRAKANGEQLSLDLVAHNEVVERERYQVTPSAFRLVEAADETYAPAVDLLRFPGRTGDTWKWQGKMTTGGIARNAEADITTASENDLVRVTVALRMFADAGRPPVERSLVFWFKPGGGLVRRAFGKISVREPLEP